MRFSWVFAKHEHSRRSRKPWKCFLGKFHFSFATRLTETFVIFQSRMTIVVVADWRYPGTKSCMLSIWEIWTKSNPECIYSAHSTLTKRIQIKITLSVSKRKSLNEPMTKKPYKMRKIVKKMNIPFMYCIWMLNQF